MRRFEGKTVLITGASSGIGRASARRFADEGAAVICAARSKDRLEQLVAELPGSGHRALALNVASEDEINAAAEELKAEHRVLDAAVFCAGLHFLRPLQMLKASHIDEMLSGNVRSVLLSTKLAMKIASKEGASIVWLSSAAAMIGGPGEAIYAASKGALISACRGLAVELSSRRIRINTVAPGVVETPMSERWLNQIAPDQKESIRSRHLLGFGSAEDVAAAIAFLSSEDARWITGTCLTVDGGLTCH